MIMLLFLPSVLPASVLNVPSCPVASLPSSLFPTEAQSFIHGFNHQTDAFSAVSSPREPGREPVSDRLSTAVVL